MIAAVLLFTITRSRVVTSGKLVVHKQVSNYVKINSAKLTHLETSFVISIYLQKTRVIFRERDLSQITNPKQ